MQSMKRREAVVLRRSVAREVLGRSADQLDQNNWVVEQRVADVKGLQESRPVARTELLVVVVAEGVESALS